MTGMPATSVAIAGLGTIGRVLARRLAAGMPELALGCVAARDRRKAQTWLDAERIKCPIVPFGDFPAHADIAVECGPTAELDAICRSMIAAGNAGLVRNC